MDGCSPGRRTAPRWNSLRDRLFSWARRFSRWWTEELFAGAQSQTCDRFVRIRSLNSDSPAWSLSAQTAAIVVLLCLVAAPLYFSQLDAPLLQPEDACYAEMAREMSVAGNWVVPLHRGQSYFEKPPLLFWFIRVAYAGFGVHDWAARLIPCVAAMATILLTFWWGTNVFGLRAGLAGALILCLSPRFVHQGRMIMVDGLLAFWVVSALALGQQAVQRDRLRWGFWFASAAACGLGLLTKGPVALILTGVPLLVYQALDRRTARPGGWIWPAYLVTAAGVAAPWFVCMACQCPGFLHEFFWTQNVELRFVHAVHAEPAWFHLAVLTLGMLPGTLLLPCLVRLLLRRGPVGLHKRPAELGFLLLSCVWCLAFFSAASCKRIGYIVPAMPTLALALGYTFDQRLPTRAFRVRRWRRCIIGTGLAHGATQAVLLTGFGVALVAVSVGLTAPREGIAMAALAVAGIGWTVYRRRRQTPAGAWIGCGVATFGLLLLASNWILPGYYRKFSIRAQVHSIRSSASRHDIPVVCYPHVWDSVSFYTGRQVRSYGPDDRDRLIADLERFPETILFVKTGPVVDDLLRHLPSSLEFVPSSEGEIVTAGVVRARRSTRLSAVRDEMSGSLATLRDSD
jgi:4-amino-4-deoxy-L-arabinose transferase-like glycosyltransferase